MKEVKYNVFDRLFNRWTKWEIYKSDQPYISSQRSSLTGEIVNEDRVMVDIYEKTNKFNGLKKYKRVVKYR